MEVLTKDSGRMIKEMAEGLFVITMVIFTMGSLETGLEMGLGLCSIMTGQRKVGILGHGPTIRFVDLGVKRERV